MSKKCLPRYRDQLEHEQQADSRMADIQRERDTADEIEKALAKVQ